MLYAYRSCERTATDWQKLLVAVDSRFKFEDVTRAPGAALSLVQAVWRPKMTVLVP